MGKNVAASDQKPSGAQWSPNYLTDGIREFQGKGEPNVGIKGYTSKVHSNPQLSTPMTVTVDLEQVQNVDRVILLPRTDAQVSDDDTETTPNFPVDFEIQLSSDEGANYAGSRLQLAEVEVYADGGTVDTGV